MVADRLIAHRYRLEEQLGAGGMGVVWRATDTELRRVVALKRSHDGDGGQIRREARLGASVQHPNVVTVYDAVLDGDDRWLVMEYLDARSLAELVRTDGPLGAGQVAAIGAQLAGALAAMHEQGMVHRDVTPGNVLLAADGTAKLTDLGISSWAQVTLTGSAQAGGTAGYLAPEVARGDEAGPAADVFSLGATLFAALEGGSPWGQGDNGPFGQVHRAVDYRLEPLRNAGALTGTLRDLLAERPARRPTADHARAMLLGEAATHRTTRNRSRLLPGRRGLAVAAAAVVLAALVGGAVLLTGDGRSPVDATPRAQAGSIGDPRSADPCSLLTPNSLRPYGKVFLDPDLGDFNRCNLNTTLPDDAGTIVTSLDLNAAEEYPQIPVRRGELGPIRRPDAAAEKCLRSFTLPDLSVVEVSAERTDQAASEQLCAMADAVVGDAHAAAAAGPIGVRRTPFDRASLARIDACGLLDDAALLPAVGRDQPVDRYFAGWACFWGHDSGRNIELYYDREWPLAGDPPDGTPIEVGGRLAFVDPDDSGEACQVILRYRTYTPALPPVAGSPPQRDEVLLLDYADPRRGDVAAMCRTARSLATAMAGKLPR